jgi:hypothetical protein
MAVVSKRETQTSLLIFGTKEREQTKPEARVHELAQVIKDTMTKTLPLDPTRPSIQQGPTTSYQEKEPIIQV